LPGNEPEAFNSLAFFLPAAIAALSVSKPFPVDPLMQQRGLHRGFHKTMSSDFPQFIIRLKRRTPCRLHL
jgi:hypothetical protein